MKLTISTIETTEHEMAFPYGIFNCPHGECLLEEDCPDCEMEDPDKYRARIDLIHKSFA